MSESILVVDDNEDVSFLLKLIFESEGYRVEIADNGASALARVAEIQPQLMLVDVMMPEISGLQVARTIREKPGFQSLPILLVSAVDHLKDEQLSASKADDIIYKPFNIDYLVSRVNELTRT